MSPVSTGTHEREVAGPMELESSVGVPAESQKRLHSGTLDSSASRAEAAEEISAAFPHLSSVVSRPPKHAGDFFMATNRKK